MHLPTRARTSFRFSPQTEASPPADGSLEAIPGAGAAPSYTPVVPCISTQRAHVYLNRADVRGALGAANDSVVPEWVICSDHISNTYVSQYPTMYPFYEKARVDCCGWLLACVIGCLFACLFVCGKGGVHALAARI